MKAYLDNAASSKCSQAALSAYVRACDEHYANPSAAHRLGAAAGRQLELDRQHVAEALGCKPQELRFTSGGTESNNWAILSAAGEPKRSKKHIITSMSEHSSVLNPVRRLEELGFEVSYLRPDSKGRVSTDELRSMLRPDTCLVSAMLVNSETGAVNPIADMTKALRQAGSKALFHCDAVQGFMKLPFSASSLGVDLMSLSAHKLHGPRGVGALYIKDGLRLRPFILGGGQESDLRSGTEPLPLIAGFSAACQELAPKVEENLSHVRGLSDRLKSALAKSLSEAVFIGENDSPYIVCLSLPRLRSQGLINCMQDLGVYVSAGSACSRGKRSHVLSAMGVSPSLIDGAIRLSFSPYTTEAEIDLAVSALVQANQRLSG